MDSKDNLLNQFLQNHYIDLADDDQFSLIAALEDYGFVEKFRSQGGKKIRLVADRWDYLRALAETEMLEHLEDREWSFGFDNGRRRAGSALPPRQGGVRRHRRHHEPGRRLWLLRRAGRRQGHGQRGG